MAHTAGPQPSTPSYAFAAFDATASHQPAGRAVRRGIVAIEGGRRLQSPIITEGAFLTAFTSEPVLPVEGVDLTGARIGDWLILFHTDAFSAASAVSFYLPGCDRLPGLAPGVWQIGITAGWKSQRRYRQNSILVLLGGRRRRFFLRRLG